MRVDHIPLCPWTGMTHIKPEMPSRGTRLHLRVALATGLAALVSGCGPQSPAPIIDGETGRPLSSANEVAPEAIDARATGGGQALASAPARRETRTGAQPVAASETVAEVSLVQEPQQRSGATDDGEVAGAGAANLDAILGLDPTAPDDRSVVAILLPLSDSNPRRRALAAAMENAARLAMEDVGPDAPRLAAYDTAGGQGGAAEAARRAVSDGAELILGPLLGSSAQEVQPVAREHGVNVITFSTDAAAAGDGVYLIGSLPSAEFRRILRFAAVERGYRTLAAILPSNSYGAAARTALRRVATETGSEIASIVTYDASFESAQQAALDFADLYQSRARLSGGPVAVLVPESGSLLATIAAFLSQRELLDGQVQLLGSGVWDAEATLREDALRGGWFAAPDPRRRAGFSGRYLQRFGSRPPLLASLAYDAAVVAGTLSARGSDEFSGREITDPAGFIGVAGAFRFTREGLNQRSLAILRVDEGGFRIIDPAPEGFPAL